jgi:hypothetical protein
MCIIVAEKKYRQRLFDSPSYMFTILDLAIRRRGLVKLMFLPLISQGKRPRYPSNRRPDGLQNRLDGVEKRIISSTVQE